MSLYFRIRPDHLLASTLKYTEFNIIKVNVEVLNMVENERKENY